MKKIEASKSSKEKAEQINTLLEQFSFEDTINFLQDKIRQSFLNLEQER